MIGGICCGLGELVGGLVGKEVEFVCIYRKGWDYVGLGGGCMIENLLGGWLVWFLLFWVDVVGVLLNF